MLKLYVDRETLMGIVLYSGELWTKWKDFVENSPFDNICVINYHIDKEKDDEIFIWSQ